jgi:serine phosphatase RsbU (regulator of sigma subunit)
LVAVLFLVIRSYRNNQKNSKIIAEQKNEVEKQHHLLQEKNNEVRDSILYAKRLQNAILPSNELIKKYLPESFVLYKPKDIVAGDFYWMEFASKDVVFVAAADSTGHGVPGAMVSVVCSNALNRALKEFGITETGKILDKTRDLVIETFSTSETDVKDGMDISLLCIDKKQRKITWSGANNPVWFIQNNLFSEIKGNKQSIGKTDDPKPFTTNTIDYLPGTVFYLFTDGIGDQFGGPKGKKFKNKQLQELILSISNESLDKQAMILNKKIDEWKGDLEQIDDICILGIKI